MRWENARQYRALFGGCLYVDAPSIVKVNGQSLISLKRNTESGVLAASFDIFDASYNKLAEVRNNNIEPLAEICQVRTNGNRRCLIDMRSEFILCDIKMQEQGGLEAEIKISLLTYSPLGIPIIFHRDGRTRIGPPSEKPYGVYGLTFDGTEGRVKNAAIVVEAGNTIYLSGNQFIECAGVDLNEII